MDGSRTLVLFDFDGTITHRDTLLAFTRFAVGEARYFSAMVYLAVPLFLQKINAMPSQRAKEIFLSHFFKDWKLSDFDERCHRFDGEVLPGLLRPQALKALQTCVQRGCRTIIVSASPENWILPWAKPLGVEVIGTRLEIQEDRLTGRLAGKNSNNEEKVNRIRQRVDLADYEAIIVYGDTSGDAAMMELATEKHYKPFR